MMNVRYLDLPMGAKWFLYVYIYIKYDIIHNIAHIKYNDNTK